MWANSGALNGDATVSNHHHPPPGWARRKMCWEEFPVNFFSSRLSFATDMVVTVANTEEIWKVTKELKFEFATVASGSVN